MFIYKIDVLEALKNAGYNSTRIYKENILSQSSVQKLRNGNMVGMITLHKICELLNVQPGDVIEYVTPKE